MCPRTRQWSKNVLPCQQYTSYHTYIMRSLFPRFQRSLRAANSGYVSAIWQGILHLVAVYSIARLCMPWLLDVLPFLLGRRLGGNPFQFFFSHLLAFSSLLGFAAGFLIVKLFRNEVVRFVWMVPVALLF